MIFVDFVVLVISLLPPTLNKPIINELLFAITSSINVTQDNQLTLFNQVKYRLKFNPSKISMQHYLNDQHDPINRLIYIEDVIQDEEIFLYNEDEGNEPTYLFNDSEVSDPEIFLYNNEEIDDLTDFIVYVPATLIYDINVLRKNIEEYKLPGMLYEIQSY